MKWKLGRFADINVYVHWSFWILPAVVLVSTMLQQGTSDAVSSVLILFAAFACVVLHEYGHALTARAYGIRTRDITLYPIGGVASLERIPRNPWQELAIAVAGPAVNVALACVFGFVLLGVLSFPDWAPGLWLAGPLTTLLAINVALVVFNLLPAFPMDGGRVLRAVLAMGMRYENATTYAARTGQVVAVLLGVLSLTVLASPALILIAAFVFFAAQAELMAVRRQALESQPLYQRTGADAWRPVTGYRPSEDGIVWVEEVRPPTDGDSRVVYIMRDSRAGGWR